MLYSRESSQTAYKRFAATDDVGALCMSNVTAHIYLKAMQPTKSKLNPPVLSIAGRSPNGQTLRVLATLLAKEGQRDSSFREQAGKVADQLSAMRKHAIATRRFVPQRAASATTTATAAQLASSAVRALDGQLELSELKTRAAKALEAEAELVMMRDELGAAKQQVLDAGSEAEQYRSRMADLENALQAATQASSPAEVAHKGKRKRTAAANDGGAARQASGGTRSRSAAGARSVIDDIRKNNQDGSEHLLGMCGRALEKLSKDIYTHESHFFSELLQNCDDNRYDPGVVPLVSLRITDTGITLINNESGFAEKGACVVVCVQRSAFCFPGSCSTAPP